MDLDDSARTNHISAGVQCSPVLRQQRPARSLEQEESSLIASQREELFTIQFGSLEHIVVPLMVQGSVVETNLTLVEDKEGWTLVTQKRQRRRKNPRCAKGKKKAKTKER